MATHVKVIGVCFIFFGALWVLGALFSGAVLALIAGVVSQTPDGEGTVGAVVLGITGVTLTTLLLAIGVPQVVCGLGLLTFKRWARVLGIVLAVIVAIMSVPIGTIFGIYALIILLSKETETLFRT